MGVLCSAAGLAMLMFSCLRAVCSTAVSAICLPLPQSCDTDAVHAQCQQAHSQTLTANAVAQSVRHSKAGIHLRPKLASVFTVSGLATPPTLEGL